MFRNPRIWIYLVVALVAAGVIAYSQWRNSDEQRLKRCVEATIAQMKQDTPALEGFDNAQPTLVAMASASCARQLGINRTGPAAPG
jgi:Flp pilus assembly protein CpaB